VNAELEITGRAQRGSWSVTWTRGSAAAFHALALPDRPAREIWCHEPDGPALVLGSTQPEEVADQVALARAGVTLVRRRSGGGAVLVEPGALTWVDVLLPSSDPLWERDLARSFRWLGDAWVTALGDLGVAGERYDGPLRNGPWGRLVCFAGLGPGEVTTPEGAKLVGMSQRRTRDSARFQCALLHRWEPAVLLGLLALRDEARARAAAELRSVAAASPTSSQATVAALLDALPP
jgi:lipoate-protein ligase A